MQLFDSTVNQRPRPTLVGLAILVLLQWLPGVAQSQPAHAQDPFAFEHLGLPYTPIRCGTGLPIPMSESQVRTAVEAAFRAAGLDGLAPYRWRSDSAAIDLDAFHPTTGIGFLYLDYARYGATMSEGFGGKPFTLVPKSPYDRWPVQQQTAPYVQAIKNGKQADFFQRKRRSNQALPDYTHYLQTVMQRTANGDPISSEEVENLVLLEYKRQVNARVAALIDRAVATPGEADRAPTLQRINLLLRTQLAGKAEVGTPLAQLQHLAFLLSAEKPERAEVQKRWNQLRTLRLLLRYQRQPYTPIIADMLKAVDHGTNWAALDLIDRVLDGYLIDLWELQTLITAPGNGVKAVLVIGPHNGLTQMGQYQPIDIDREALRERVYRDSPYYRRGTEQSSLPRAQRDALKIAFDKAYQAEVERVQNKRAQPYIDRLETQIRQWLADHR